ncbi:formyltransferase family protein [Archangium violaceum]|uniref:methionyl-tRNA formyltransferase n=1 Tax=Archangium violaceum TaxID=83451 RepID=UPI002B2C2243|nr:formyltransferase family protein [Archangium gephyra]
MPLSSSSPVSFPVSYHGWRIALLTVSADVVTYFGDLLRARGHELVALVLPAGQGGPRPQDEQGWSVMHQLVRATPPGTDVLIASQRVHLAPLLSAVRPDFVLSFFFPWRIPPEAFSVPPLGTVNVHPSLLPRHRGPNPLGWTLRGHEPEVGLSFHRMEADFDTGPVLAQGRRPLHDEDTVEVILQKVMALAGELLPDVLSRVAWGEPGEPQSPEQGSYAGLFEDAYREIDWTQPARSVHLQVRACRMAPFRGGREGAAFTTLQGQRLRVLSTRLVDPGAPVPGAPGTVLVRHESGALLVQCGDGPLCVLQSEPWRD